MPVENRTPSFLSKISALETKIQAAIKQQELHFATPGEFRKWITMENQLSAWVKALSISLPAKMRVEHNDYYIQDQAGLADYFAYSFHEFFPPARGELILSSSEDDEWYSE